MTDSYHLIRAVDQDQSLGDTWYDKEEIPRGTPHTRQGTDGLELGMQHKPQVEAFVSQAAAAATTTKGPIEPTATRDAYPQAEIRPNTPQNAHALQECCHLRWSGSWACP